MPWRDEGLYDAGEVDEAAGGVQVHLWSPQQPGGGLCRGVQYIEYWLAAALPPCLSPFTTREMILERCGVVEI